MISNLVIVSDSLHISQIIKNYEGEQCYFRALWKKAVI